MPIAGGVSARGRPEWNEKISAAASEASVSAPTLKSSWWKTLRRALHSIAAIVSASASAARGPMMAAPASAPTALTEIVPVRSTSIESAWPTPTSATIATQAERRRSSAADERREHARCRCRRRRRRPTSTARRRRRSRGSAGPACACGTRRRRGGRPRGAASGTGGSARTGSTVSLRQADQRAADARSSGCASSGSLGGVEDTVSALELRAVDGEVGLVDELVRVAAVARERGDADRDRRADRLARGRRPRTRSRRRRGGSARRSRAPRAARVSGSRIENSSPPKRAGTSYSRSCSRKILATPGEHRVAGEVAVRVVDVAQQVEVGHDQRHRPVEAARRAPSSSRSVAAKWRALKSPVFGSTRASAWSAGTASERWTRSSGASANGHQPRVVLPERRDADAERREHEVGREVLEREEARSRAANGRARGAASARAARGSGPTKTTQAASAARGGRRAAVAERLAHARIACAHAAHAPITASV